MTEATKRARANKRKGAQFEIELEGFFARVGLAVIRLVRRGKDDEGDLLIRVGGLAVIVEAKNQQALDLAGFMSEATAEAIRWEQRHVHDANAPQLVIGAAIVKRRMKAIDKAYVVIEVDDFAQLLLHLQGR
jgi:Holliday junction resolvase